MKRRHLASGTVASLISLVALLQPAYATQPPDGVTSDASGNTASGSNALLNLTAGSSNSAFGANALPGNTTASHNSAFGDGALEFNSTGQFNTAVGYWALWLNATGQYNIAVGYNALYNNTTGSGNTAVGATALFSNTTGQSNAAFGYSALYSNTTGQNNTAFGALALTLNSTGKGNAAQGSNALANNTTGIRNVGIGNNALILNTSGSYNIGLGMNAGSNQTTGNDNIYIANLGIAGESQTLRLGTQGTSGVVGSGIRSAYMAGVVTATVTGSAVYITPSGQLGVLASSERFKTDVKSMGASSDKLAQLRPVTFKLKTDPDGTTQYGLIAEEVAKVYPELAIHGADGRINGVRYEELAPMLLNEVQHQNAQLAARGRKMEQLQAREAELLAKSWDAENLQEQAAKVQRLKKQFTELAARYRAAGSSD